MRTIVLEGAEPRPAEPQVPPVIVPAERLAPDVLRALMIDRVTSNGTDYGAVEAPLERKLQELQAALGRGEAVITFDPTTETCNIVHKRELLAAK